VLFLVAGVTVGDNVGMQGFSDRQRELLDADSLTGHLLPTGSVFGFLAERHNANTRYTTTLAGSNRTRVSRRSALANTSSTVSRSINRISTPKPITSVNRADAPELISKSVTIRIVAHQLTFT
jgi:hypothetical protein